MNKAKVAVTINQLILEKIDNLVKLKIFSNRSQAIENAIAEKLEKIDKTRLSRELEKLDQKFEQKLADTGLIEDIKEWPEY